MESIPSNSKILNKKDLRGKKDLFAKLFTFYVKKQLKIQYF